ncbi:MAG: protein kinase, partial [Planctomycetota bacterium]
MPIYCPACGKPSHHGSVVPGQAMICPHCTSRIAAPSSAETLPPADEATPQPRPVEPEGVPFGRYRLVQELGRGGMGVVWKAWDMQIGRVVALKQILVAGGLPVGRGERFLREARIAARLHHPGIVSVLDVGEHDGRPYYTAEFIDGERLEERMRPRIEVRQAVVWTKAIAEALHHAHAQGVIHRDVKPGNVLIDRQDRPHVMDFGLAKEVRPEGTPGARLTAEGVLMGTPQYMSPEQAGGKADRIGPASDQFALGVSLYEMIAGRLPFEGESQLDLLNAICDKEPARLADADADVRTIVMKALEKDPAARYPT